MKNQSTEILRWVLLVISLHALILNAMAQNVGIGTTSPVARLHVADSNVLYTGPVVLDPLTPFKPPVEGAGVRFMWYPQKGALRVGMDYGTSWNKDSIGGLSVALGESNVASGFGSTALGGYNRAINTVSTALGEFNNVTGYAATALGAINIASGLSSLATGENTIASGQYATSMGNFTMASGQASTAMGKATIASGDSSVAMGSRTVASGISATAMGRNTTASGIWSTALGNSTTASGPGSLAAGVSSKAEGSYSIAMGQGAKALLNTSISLGYATTASNYFSLATGNQTTASGQASTAMGYASEASGVVSMAVGYATKAKSDYGFAAGIYNDTTGLNKIFEVGIGASNVTRKNAITVTSAGGGRIGIFKTNPVIPFEISFSNTSGSYHPSALLGLQHNGTHYINMISNNSGEQGLLFGNLNSGSDGGIIYRALTESFDPQAIYFRSASWTRFAIYNSGNAWVQGNLTQSSDEKLKKDITPLSNALQAIRELNGYMYYWKDTNRSGEQQVGLIAQEVQKLYPQLVGKDPEGNLSLNYTGLIPVLIEGIKELQQQVDELKKQNIKQ